MKSFPQILTINIIRKHAEVVTNEDGSREFKGYQKISTKLKYDKILQITQDGVVYNYKLYAVILHGGNQNGGHYVSRVLKEDKWYECSDTQITELSGITHDTSRQIKMLFYQKERIVRQNAGSLSCCKKDCDQNREEDSFFCLNHNINSISKKKEQSYDFLFN